MGKLTVADGVFIPEEAIEFQAVRASGPGGQNVNKVASKVVLRLAIDRIEGLSPGARNRLLAMAGHHGLRGEILQVAASDTRNQLENRQLAEGRLVALIQAALVVPKFRRKTKPTKGSQERRLDAKRGRADIKKERGRQAGDE